MNQILTCLLIVINSNAFAQNFQWAKAIGASGYDAGYSIAAGASGNVYTTGYFAGTVDFDPGPGTYLLPSDSMGNTGIFVVKLDATGNFIWAKAMGGSGPDGSYSLALDAAENVYITGFFSGTGDFDPGPNTHYLTSVGSSDIFVCKLDSSGAFAWAVQMGGTLDGDVGNNITTDDSGNVLVTGFFTNSGDFDPGVGIYNLTSAGYEDIFVCKLDPSGNLSWAKRFGGTEYDYGISIAADADGNVYSTGSFEEVVDFDPGTGTYNLTAPQFVDNTYISKLSPSGDFVWAKQLAGSGSGGQDIIILDRGILYTTGWYWGTTDFDPGNGTVSLTSTGPIGDLYVLKLDTAGNFDWVQPFGGTGIQDSYSIAADASANLFIGGFFHDSMDCDPGPGTFMLNSFSSGHYDIFIMALNSSGNFLSALQMGGIDDDLANGLALDTGGNVYATGNFKGTCDFDPGAGNYFLTSGIDEDIFIVKLDNMLATVLKETQPLPEILIARDQSEGIIRITCHSCGIDRAELYDVSGKKIKSQVQYEKNTSRLIMDVRDVPFGIYFLHIQSGPVTTVKKLGLF